MINLDDAHALESFDKGNVLGSVRAFSDQMESAWSGIMKSTLPANCSSATEVVISGMGGSALGGRIIDSLSPQFVRVPIEVFTGYELPNYVGEKTLVIVSSYSGNTEETLASAREALAKKCQVFAISTGGKLAVLAEEEKFGSFIFDPAFNPAGQPRLGLGYSVMSILGVLAKCEFIKLPDSQVKEVIKNTRKMLMDFAIEATESVNPAKRLARELKGKMPIIVTSEHLVGAAHAVKNELNESAKTFALLFDLPELNHHLMEGLRNPAQAKEYWQFLFFESGLFDSRVSARYPITKRVLDKNEVGHSSYEMNSETKLEQVFELLALGSYLQFYLAALYEINPLPIPWVDYFKKELEK